MNETLNTLAILSLIAAFLCVLVILFDLRKRPQTMAIMNVVWSITALYAGPLGLLTYFKIGRADEVAMPMQIQMATTNASASPPAMKMPAPRERPFWERVVIGTTHCGAGCTVADVIGHWLIFWVPFALFGRVLFGAWTLDYILALIIGVAFQFAALQPMLKLPAGETLRRAFKVDFLSLTAWQIGMYGWMALVVFVIMKREMPPTEPAFWFMMQLAMLAGFVTVYPVDWWLISKGIKTAM